MTRITTAEMVRAINDLPKDQAYRYINPTTATTIRIEDVNLPEGPIFIKRYDPQVKHAYKNAKRESISTEMIARVAGFISPNHPINIDRILGASYNTRSALETLLALTPTFYACYPGRLDSYSGVTMKGHKHIMWCPDDPHKRGVIEERETSVVISEVPSTEFVFDNLLVPKQALVEGVDIEVQRQHARMQIALILIGQHLGYRSWIAKNDHAIKYKNIPLVEMDGVLGSLKESNILTAFESATTAAEFIDLIWLSNHKHIPAVMEIEHTTGVTSGLTRMKKLRDKMPAINTKYIIVAPEGSKQLVSREVSQTQFSDLSAKFLPYSAVEELLSLSSRRQLKGVTIEFIDTFLEPLL